MSVMDHRRSHVMDTCSWCEDRWPCEAARVRQDLADYLRSLPVSSTGYPDYLQGLEAGIQSAADSIDI